MRKGKGLVYIFSKHSTRDTESMLKVSLNIPGEFKNENSLVVIFQLQKEENVLNTSHK